MTELTQGSVVAERFRLVKRLGQGGFATVWLADDSGSSPMRTVALKIMHTRSRVHRELADRFLQEARMLIGLDHPGVARAYHVHEDEHFLCYAMEYVEGHTLRDEMGRRAREGRVFALPEVASIASSLGRTLDYAHQRKLVHRDLKPANLIVVSAMEDQGPARYCLKLVDFGIAKDLTVEADGATTAGRTLGTYSYMTPEQTRSAAVSARTDVFAMAGVLFEVITLKRAWLRDESGFPQPYGGALVFDGPNMPGAIFDRLSRGPRPSIAACGSRLPAEVVSFLDRALGRAFAVDPADRQASAGALALEIVEALHIATSVDHLVTLRDTPLDEIEPAVTRPAPVVSAARPDDGGWPSGPVPVVTRKPVTKADLKPPPMADWMVIPQPFSRSDALLTGYAIGEHSAVPPAFPEARAAVSIVNEAERPRPPDPASVIDVPVPKPALGTGFAIAKRTETQLKPFTDFDRHIRAPGLRLFVRAFIVTACASAAYFLLQRGVDLRVGAPALVVLASFAIVFTVLGGLGERRAVKLLAALTNLRTSGDLTFHVDGQDGDRGYMLSMDAPGARSGVLVDARRLRVRLKTSPRWRHAWTPYEARLSVTLPDGADTVLGKPGTWRAFPIDAVITETIRAARLDGAARRTATDAAWLLRNLDADTLETNANELAAVIYLKGHDPKLMAESLAKAARALLVTARLLWSGQVPSE